MVVVVGVVTKGVPAKVSGEPVEVLVATSSHGLAEEAHVRPAVMGSTKEFVPLDWKAGRDAAYMQVWMRRSRLATRYNVHILTSIPMCSRLSLSLSRIRSMAAIASSLTILAVETLCGTGCIYPLLRKRVHANRLEIFVVVNK